LAVPLPHVQIILDDCPVPLNLKQALSRIKAAVHYAQLRDASRQGPHRSADAVVIVPGQTPFARPDVQRVLDWMVRRPRAALVMTGAAADDLAQLPRPAWLPVSFVNGVTPGELAGRLAAMLDYGRSLAAQTAAHIEQQAAQAAEIQRKFLPRHPPILPGWRFYVLYHPAAPLSGDIYGFERIDAGHVGFWLADVCGHGFAAAMMTGFIKRSIAASLDGRSISPAKPDAVLQRLNQDLCEHDGTGESFVAAAWAILTPGSGRVQWARAGLPYPILVRRQKGATLVRSTGCVLGAVQHTHLQRSSLRLNNGDALLLYTDGLESLLCGPNALASGAIMQTDWSKNLAHHPVHQSLATIETLLSRSHTDRPDDLSLLAIERTSDNASHAFP
jgi:serine phosphatase RsbU (regulator of sigma subunit)